MAMPVHWVSPPKAMVIVMAYCRVALPVHLFGERGRKGKFIAQNKVKVIHPS